MTKSSSDSIRKVADPATILGQISNATMTPVSSESPQSTCDRPRLRVVHADTESFDDRLDQPLELPQQVAELAGHLKRRQAELSAKELALNTSIESWRSSVDAQGAANANRERQLKGREQQLRSLQFHLLQVQNDVIDSQLAMEKVIEHFENSESDQHTHLALELLRFEVLERFDYLSKRWELLHGRLESLYQQPQAQRRVA